MRISILCVVGALVLSGCATQPTQGNVSDTVKQIQAYTRTFCAFVPTIQTIVSIVNAGAGSALSIANEICAAVTTAPLAQGGTRYIVVRGVRVKGQYVR